LQVFAHREAGEQLLDAAAPKRATREDEKIVSLLIAGDLHCWNSYLNQKIARKKKEKK
jgi:hypothetical protein